ncbi:tyrosine-type recombinase/integrase [Methanothermobacter sp. K4]|uniref:tyrosine-type recombinase/integrase n=1 Tax=Methanothermobacter sp. K4 TaxID=2913262 RepID=UPI001EDC3C3F|nr:tyrosine-type recombinase/integrase [Methanothermobacter sp. K4]MCG2827709.1 site-specific integrase [Methanothermobacter sp. K4]
MPTKKPSPDKVTQDPLFQDFILTRNIKQGTIRSYIAALQYYLPVTGKKNLTELIEEAENEQDRGVRRRKRRIRTYFIKYIKALEENGIRESTINLYLSRLKTIYNEYEIDTPRITYKTNTNNNASLEELLTIEEVKHVVDNVKIREKAIILLHLTSGMGAAEVQSLTLHDYNSAIGFNVLGGEYNELKKRIMDEEIIGVWKIRRVKTGMPYVTFSTPEANLKILEYLKHRKLKGVPATNSEDPLFVSRSNKPIMRSNYMAIFERINDSLGMGFCENGSRRFTSHKLRKLFTSILYKEGMDKLMIDWCLGHKVNPVTEAYFKANIEHLKREYRKRMHALTLEKSRVRRVMSDEVREIVRELEAKEREIKELRESQEKLREWVKKTEKLYNIIVSDPEFLKRMR